MIGIEVFGGIEKKERIATMNTLRNFAVKMDHMIAMAHYTGIKMQIFVMRI